MVLLYVMKMGGFRRAQTDRVVAMAVMEESCKDGKAVSKLLARPAHTSAISPSTKSTRRELHPTFGRSACAGMT